MVTGPFVLTSGFDPHGFLADVQAAKEAVGPASEADARHLQWLVSLGRLLAWGGHALLLLSVAQPVGVPSAVGCLLAAVMISTARCMRWTIIGHHISHGGFDKLQKAMPGTLPGQYRRGAFAVGWRRLLDWLDWMLPEAWDVEHNKLHHYYLSEDKDPDLVERNFQTLQQMPLPVFLKYASMAMWIFTWKVTYYSPNTFKELQLSRPKSWVTQNWPKTWSSKEPLTVVQFVQGPAEALLKGSVRDALFWPVFLFQWLAVIFPMLVLAASPALPPLVLGAAGAWPFAAPFVDAAWRALAVAVLIEALTNAHSFVIIACNHSGRDLCRYTTSCKAYSAEWFLRCTYSSANFETGSDLVDCVYGWLNYQIEHHMFPDMTPLQYRKLQPLIKSVCNKHCVQYVQQNALVRTWKMFRVAVGSDSMRRCEAILPPTAAKAAAAAPTPEEDRLIGG